MTDFKIWGRCFSCKGMRFFVRKRELKLPIGRIAKSRELFCGTCSRRIAREYEENLKKNAI